MARNYKDTRRFGAQNGNAKLTEDEVREIRRNVSGLSQRKRAKLYNVNRSTIEAIDNYQSWPGIE